MRKIIFSFLFLFAFFNVINAANIPSCYELNKMQKIDKINNAIFVLIDETTPFDDTLKNQILSNALPFAKSGNHIFIARFSAFLQGKYNETLFDFSLDYPLSKDERNNTAKTILNKLDKCFKDQQIFVAKNIKINIEKAFLKDGEEISKSDIFKALKDFSVAIKDIKAERKIVILASDMLENSDITSFYNKGAVRQIDPKKELKIVENIELFADFDNAEIYIIGAGITQTKKSYINTKMLNALNSFWKEYFIKSNANLKEFGSPALNRQIK